MTESRVQKCGVLMLSQCFPPNVGGVETHLTDLTQYLAEQEVPTVILTYKPLVTPVSAPFHEKHGSVSIYRLPWIGCNLFNRLEPYPTLQFLYLYPVLAVAAFVFMLFRGHTIATIHVHGMVCAVMGRLLKLCFRRRLIVSTHAIYSWLYDLDAGRPLPSFLRWVLRGADRTIALSDCSRLEIVSIGVPDAQVGRFTYWVDQKTFIPLGQQSSRKTLGYDDRFTVLFVGRLFDYKGVELLLDIAVKCPEIQFVFAGDGPLRGKLDAAASTHSNIKAVGHIANSELPILYSAADVLCVPSQYKEGFGRIIPEGLSCGCAVVGANRGGIPEAMDSSVGILIEPVEDELHKAILTLWREPDKLEEMRRNARPYAMRNFSSSNGHAIQHSYMLPKSDPPARPESDPIDSDGTDDDNPQQGSPEG